MRNLMRNREDTAQVFLLNDALRGKTTLRQLARFRRSEIGPGALADRRRLIDRLSDRATLAALPTGTVGRTYHEFMLAEDLSAAGLVEASLVLKKPAAADAVTWFRERNRDMHDLLHVVTGYGRDPLGEACLTAFSFAQTGMKGFALIAAVTSRRLLRALPGQPVTRAIFEGYRRGRRAAWLIGADWEELLARPVAGVRAQFAVSEAIYYPQIVASAHYREIIAAPPQAAAAMAA